MTYEVFIKGEDGIPFTIEVEADSASQAMDEAEDIYPEATIVEAYDPQQRRQDAYDRAQAIYDNPDLDLEW